MVYLPMPGAQLQEDGRCRFIVWAPYAQTVDVELVAEGRVHGRERLQRDEWGYHQAEIPGIHSGEHYHLVLDGKVKRPDPASRSQPEGVHGPSAVVAPGFPWTDHEWRNRPLASYVLYELHVGTFSREGTFAGVIPHLPYLRELGITAIEIMPVAQFPGGRNWGYDGVLPFAAQDTYGGPDGLRQLVDACHREGLAVVLDVVYNHLGPEGNYLADFGPYFTDTYSTPWGKALNFDQADSDHVRNYFIQNALYWTRDCHIDALRLDAVHAIMDHAAVPFVEELGAEVHRAAEESGRAVYLIAESSDNDSRLITECERNGYGMDAQWSDDFHHSVRTLLSNERSSYYQDYGELEYLRKALAEGFVYTGQYSPYRRRRHGASSAHLPGERFVISIQNHDQVGNRLLGERLSALVPVEAQKLAAACMLLAPNVPMLFMGEEYGETAPFQYFISHTDEGLVDAVRKGRKQEFADFGWTQEPPDPQATATFEACRLDHSLRHARVHARMLAWYRALLNARRSVPALAGLDKSAQAVRIIPKTSVLSLHRWAQGSGALAFLNFAAEAVDVSPDIPAGQWRRMLSSNDDADSGPLELTGNAEIGRMIRMAPYQAVLFMKD